MTPQTKQVVELSSTVTAEIEEPDRVVLWRDDMRGGAVRISLTRRAEDRLLELLLSRLGTKAREHVL